MLGVLSGENWVSLFDRVPPQCYIPYPHDTIYDKSDTVGPMSCMLLICAAYN
jgi:hypothetical protein